MTAELNYVEDDPISGYYEVATSKPGEALLVKRVKAISYDKWITEDALKVFSKEEFAQGKPIAFMRFGPKGSCGIAVDQGQVDKISWRRFERVGDKLFPDFSSHEGELPMGGVLQNDALKIRVKLQTGSELLMLLYYVPTGANSVSIIRDLLADQH